MSYVPLWCKSNYSFLEGASHPEELISQATFFRLPAIAAGRHAGAGRLGHRPHALCRGSRAGGGHEALRSLGGGAPPGVAFALRSSLKLPHLSV